MPAMVRVRSSQADASLEPHVARADPMTRRFVYALVLLPIVPAISIVGATALNERVLSSPWDQFRLVHLLLSVLWVGLSILIWRRAIIWTLGRKRLTALVSMIPFVQVVYGQPIWDAGCVSADILRMGQHQIGIGVWVWLAIWVWWGWEKKTEMSTTDLEASMMNPSVVALPVVKRMVASIGSIPFLFGVFVIILIALDDLAGLSGSVGTASAYGLSSIVAAAVWITIWREYVVWSRRTEWLTIVGAALLLIGPSAAQLAIKRADTFPEIALGALPVIGWGMWMAGTVSYWPMRPLVGDSTRDRFPRCLKCGYLLIGLRATRCPECGDEPTLDELWGVAPPLTGE
ncbi:MAG: hypothetical protein ACE5HE_09030 [Phycisphaerae bacterium]